MGQLDKGKLLMQLLAAGCDYFKSQNSDRSTSHHLQGLQSSFVNVVVRPRCKLKTNVNCFQACLLVVAKFQSLQRNEQNLRLKQ